MKVNEIEIVRNELEMKYMNDYYKNKNIFKYKVFQLRALF